MPVFHWLNHYGAELNYFCHQSIKGINQASNKIVCLRVIVRMKRQNRYGGIYDPRSEGLAGPNDVIRPHKPV